MFKDSGEDAGGVRMAKEKDAERESLVSRADWLWGQRRKASEEVLEAVAAAAAAAAREKQALAMWHKCREAVSEYDRKKRTAKRTKGDR